MKKLQAILQGKQGNLSPIKEKKIRTSIEVALLNAEDDMQTKELEYEQMMGRFGDGHYIFTLDCLVSIKRDILDIATWVTALKAVQADLDAEVEVEE